MLWRRGKSPDASPPEPTIRRRRRTLVLVVAGFLAVLFLGTTLFLTAWLREAPPIDPRWARLEDAVAVVRLRWTGAAEPLMRAPLESALGPRLPSNLSFGAFWASVKFLIHSDFTVWFVPAPSESSGATARTDGAGGEALSWIGALSLRRRPAFIENRVRRLLSEAGVSLPLDRKPRAEALESGRRGNLVAGVRSGSVVVTSRESRLEGVLGSLALAAQTPGGKPSPESVDDLWLRMPEDAPLEFVIRDPGIWAPRVFSRVLGKVRSPALQSIFDAVPELLQGTPWVIGEGKVVALDTVEITVRWSWGTAQDAFADQQRSLRLLIQNANGIFQRIEGVRVEALPLDDAATGRVGMRIRIEGWSGLFPISGKKE